MDDIDASTREDHLTGELVALCKNSEWKPDITVLARYVEEGVNIFGTGLILFESLFHTLISESNVEAVKACLKTQRPIDFTVTGSKNRTALHYLCEVYSDAAAKEMMESIIERIETHPKDFADWSLTDQNGKDFISLAAEKQKLALMWPLVREIPFFGDKINPITLHTAWRWDFEQLDPEDKLSFSVEEFEEASKPTGTLIKLCRLHKPNIEAIKQCVSDGADIFYQDPETLTMVLHSFVWNGDVDAVRACLSISQPIDFNTRDIFGESLLRYIWSNNKSASIVTDLLLCIAERLEKHPEDRVDWMEKDGDGDDTFSIAASFGMLSLFWNIAKSSIAFFRDFTGPVLLTVKADSNDWNNLSVDDKKIFCAIRGFKK